MLVVWVGGVVCWGGGGGGMNGCDRATCSGGSTADLAVAGGVATSSVGCMRHVISRISRDAHAWRRGSRRGKLSNEKELASVIP